MKVKRKPRLPGRWTARDLTPDPPYGMLRDLQMERGACYLQSNV
jgi:hypothetical protein